LEIIGSNEDCIFLYKCHDIRISKNFCKNSSKIGIHVQDCYNIYIDSNLVTECHTGIELVRCTNNIKIFRNQLLNIVSPTLLKDGTGNSIEMFQTNGSGLSIDSNVIEHTSTAKIDGVGNGAGDNIDILESNGTSDSPIKCYYNIIRGGGTYILHDGRCGIGIGDVGGKYQDCEYNILVNTGWAGIQQAGGSYINVSNNKIYSDNLPWSMVGLHSFITGSGVTADHNVMKNNVINWHKGYGGSAQGDVVYSSDHNNPEPEGFRTSNKLSAVIGPSILPKHIITFITTEKFNSLIKESN